MLVRSGQPFAGIDHDEHRVRLVERSYGLLDHAFVDALLTPGNAAGVDNEVGNRTELAEAVLAIARQSRVVRNERITRSRQPVE